MSNCPCTAPTTGWLCPTCLNKLRADIERTPDILTDLQVTAHRQNKHTTNTGSSNSTESKPPLNLTATMLHLDIELLIRAMYQRTSGRSGAGASDRFMAHFITLGQNFPALCAHKGVVKYAHQLPRLLDRALVLIDVPANLVRLGVCPTPHCGTELVARETDVEVNCLTCGHEFNIHQLRLSRILLALGDYGVPVRASEAVRRFNAAGVGLTPQNVKDWVRRGNLQPTAVDEQGRSLYNLTDVYTVFMRQAA